MQKREINFVFLLLIILYLPFLELLTSVLQTHTRLSESMVFWSLHWYEPIILILLILNIKGIVGLLARWRNSGFWVIVLLAIGVINILFSTHIKELGIEGFRFTLVYGLTFLLSLVSEITSKQKTILFRAYLAIALIIAAIALIERFLPEHYWEAIGITDPNYAFGYGYHHVVAVIQSTSLIGAPNQLGTYLVPAFFLLLVQHIKLPKLSATRYLLVVIIALAIVLTFSRSAIVGVILGTLLYVYYVTKKKYYLILLPAIIGAAWLIWSFASHEGNRVIMDLFTHGASQESHLRAMTDSFEEMHRRLNSPGLLLFGSGLGTAGPIALKYGGMVSESWYLQLILEMGVVGLVVWLIFIFQVSKEQIKKGDATSQGLLFGLISVMIAALFLHTFADNPAMSMTLFALLGLGYNKSQMANRKTTSQISNL